MSSADDDLRRLLQDAFDREAGDRASPGFTQRVVRSARATEGPGWPSLIIGLLLAGFLAASAGALIAAPAVIAELRDGLLFWFAP
jgi:hypothetical protein